MRALASAAVASFALWPVGCGQARVGGATPVADASSLFPDAASPAAADAAEARDAAVSDEGSATGASDDASGALTDGQPADASGPCAAVVEQHPIEGALHVAVCSQVTYGTKPPSSGDHYPIWAAYETYAAAIPEGYWVHDLEHGAVVVSYDCPGGCAADVAAAQAWIDALPGDPLCDPEAGDPRLRVLMTPDPNLDVRFAASAWGWTLRADCFDPVAFSAFFQAHYGQGPEALCAQGEDLSAGVPDGCGE